MSEDDGPQGPRTAGTDEGMLAQLVRSPRPGRWSRRARWLLLGDRPEPYPPAVGLYEAPAADRDDIGVCCSGGGIRSASFNLGALQTLQKRQVLGRSKYLTAVSGGSYIAAAFCMVAKTSVTPEDTDDSDAELVREEAPPFEPGSPDEQYLRNHLSYLAPNGLARVYLALRMLAGLFVNVLLIGLPVLIAGLVIGWIARTHYGGLEHQLAGCEADGRPTKCDYSAVIPDAVVNTVGGLALAAAALAVLGVLWRPTSDKARLFIETWQVRCLLLAVAGAVLWIVVPWLTAMALDRKGVSVDEATAVSSLTAFSSVAALFVAALSHVRGMLRDEKRAIAGATKALGRYAKRVRHGLIAFVVMLAGPLLLVAICVLGVLLAILVSPADAKDTFATPLGELTPSYAWWLGGSTVLLAVTYGLVDLTSVSLHPFYRRQLATAFALKRVWIGPDGEVGNAPAPGETKPGRAEARQRSFDKLVPLSRSGIDPGCCKIKDWPMLVVCAAANVSDPGATPPGRSVGSFTFSPKAIGGPLTGAARTEWYETDLGFNRRRDLTLPAAVAMSGAAISPAMGKLTYRPLTFLLALANIRLGVWVPNPTHIKQGRDTPVIGKSRQSALSPARCTPWAATEAADRKSLRHRPRPVYLWKEIMGRNRLDDRFLYVTDGGHYENLGLVELLRRGCRTIYCFDAGGGFSAAALGDAIALARSELNVEIEMEPETFELAEDPESRRSARSCARGRIRYPSGPDGESVDGTLIYARSVVCEEAPWPLLNYQDVDRVFPHHSTFDQFFDDQRFEAYRVLGAWVADQALELERLHEVETTPRKRRTKPRPPAPTRKVKPRPQTDHAL